MEEKEEDKEKEEKKDEVKEKVPEGFYLGEIITGKERVLVFNEKEVDLLEQVMNNSNALKKAGLL